MSTDDIENTNPAPVQRKGGWPKGKKRTRQTAVQREPVKAYFQRSARCMGGAAGRSGSGRRGGSKGSTPRHLRYAL